MKKIMLIIAILLFPCLSFADFTCDHLLDYCNLALDDLNRHNDSLTTVRGSICYGYILGVRDSNYWDENHDQRICQPDGVTPKQIIQIVVQFLKEHPEGLHANAEIYVESALIVAFPCKE